MNCTCPIFVNNLPCLVYVAEPHILLFRRALPSKQGWPTNTYLFECIYTSSLNHISLSHPHYVYYHIELPISYPPITVMFHEKEHFIHFHGCHFGVVQDHTDYDQLLWLSPVSWHAYLIKCWHVLTLLVCKICLTPQNMHERVQIFFPYQYL